MSTCLLHCVDACHAFTFFDPSRPLPARERVKGEMNDDENDKLLLAISMAVATSSVALDEPGGGELPKVTIGHSPTQSPRRISARFDERRTYPAVSYRHESGRW